MLKRKLEVFGKRLFVTGIVLGLFLAGCAGNPEVTSDAGAVEKEEVVDSKEGDVLQEQEVQEGKENSKESDISQEHEVQEGKENSQESDISQETSDQNNKDDYSDIEAALQDIKDNALTNEQLNEIYLSIQETVKSKYLDQNGIDPKVFAWPGASDNAWLYLDCILGAYGSRGELYNTEGINVANMPSEQNQQLMNAVLDGIIVWLQLNENFGVGDILIDLDPMEETISANVDFTD